MTPDPIRIPCEGSGCPAHFPDATGGICSMCGHVVPTDGSGTAYRHNRDDILAMIERGDFG